MCVCKMFQVSLLPLSLPHGSHETGHSQGLSYVNPRWAVGPGHNLANDCSFSRCAFALSWLALATAGSILQKSTEREWWGCGGGRKVKARLSCLDAYNFPKSS